MLSVSIGGMTRGCPKEYYCLSTDEKPVATADSPIPNGSRLIEMDTKKIYMYDEEHATWISW